MIQKIWLLAILSTALLWPGLAAAAASHSGFGTGNDGIDRGTSKNLPVYKHSTPAFHNKSFAPKTLGGETLQSRLDGSFDIVEGLLTFPWTSPDDPNLELELVAMSLPATATGSDNGYTVSGWHREFFFLDVGDSVPRLLSARLIDPEFVPDPDDLVTESGQLWIAEFNIYQEGEELERDPDFYAGFPLGGAFADLRFVTDADGNVLELVVDIFDGEGENYLYTIPPRVGDRLNPTLNGYDLAEPDIVYLLLYFDDVIAVTDDLFVQRQYFVPTGAIDPALPEGFDSGTLRLSFFLEGIRSAGDGALFSYGDVETFDYTWAEAKSADAPPPAAGGRSSSGALSLTLLTMLLGLGWARRRAARTRRQ